MSAPITLAERTTILTILDIMDALEIVRLDSRGILMWEESIPANRQTASQRIDAYLAALTSAQIDRVRVLIAQWTPIEFGEVAMVNGSVGGAVTGATFSFEAQRIQIRKYMQQIVPFARVTDDMRQARRGMSTQVLM